MENISVMRTTLDLPEELLRRLEQRAARDGRTPEQVAAELLAAGLSHRPASGNGNTPSSAGGVPKRLPLIKARAAAPVDVSNLSAQQQADWLKDVELQYEVERYEKALGHQHVDRTGG
jgi:plasmid stability protein